MELELELDQASSTLVGMLDRVLSRQDNPISDFVSGIMTGVFGDRAAGSPRPPPPRSSRPPPPRGTRREPPPRPPPPPPPPNPLVKAREILGFEASDKLTADIVRARRKALATALHPDKTGGSEKAMQRVNAAADALLANLG